MRRCGVVEGRRGEGDFMPGGMGGVWGVQGDGWEERPSMRLRGGRTDSSATLSSPYTGYSAYETEQ